MQRWKVFGITPIRFGRLLQTCTGRGTFGYSHLRGQSDSVQFVEQANQSCRPRRGHPAGQLIGLRRWLTKDPSVGRMFTPGHLAQRVTAPASARTVLAYLEINTVSLPALMLNPPPMYPSPLDPAA